PMCSYPNLKRQKGFMDWNLFEKIVDDAAENGHDIASLHFLGEPLLWPHIVEGVALLAKNGIFPRLSTNGMLLTGELAHQLQDAGLKEIMVTIDTLIPEVYSKIRTGGKLSVVKQNIRDALDAAPNLLLSAQLMPTKYNPNETEEDFYKEFGRRPNFRVQPWFVIRMNDSEDMSQCFSHQADEVDKRLCDKPFDRVDVLWDGTTVLCCLDDEGELVTGNLKENSIAYSWMGPKAMSLRKKILRGEWADLESCKQCLADHIVMSEEHWRLTSPPAPLPSKYKKLLDEIEKLETFDERTGKWSKAKKKRWFGF
ncbi:radical SAM protein, partial [bacterium]|nr:radical SAM protein [bacterium]